jgi:hypothetical protein
MADAVEDIEFLNEELVNRDRKIASIKSETASFYESHTAEMAKLLNIAREENLQLAMELKKFKQPVASKKQSWKQKRGPSIAHSKRQKRQVADDGLDSEDLLIIECAGESRALTVYDDL